MTFFCGGSQIFAAFLPLFDATAPIGQVADDILRHARELDA